MSSPALRTRVITLARLILPVLAIHALALGAQPGPIWTPSPMPAPPPLRDGAHDFDLLTGTWRVTDGRLLHPLSGRDADQRFTRGRVVVRALGPGELALDEWSDTRGEDRRVGFAQLSYDARTKQWTIQESDSGAAPLGTPLVGYFDPGDVATFYGQREIGGRSVLVRWAWRMFAHGARWERAYSTDGTTWETNWIVHLDRAPSDSAHRATRRPSTRTSDVIMCCRQIELLRYSVPADNTTALFDLFDREGELTDDTEAAQNIALFRDLDAPGEYVWLRGYPGSFNSGALTAYYQGALWAAHLEELERASMRIRSAQVFRPAPMTPGLAVGSRPERRPRGGSAGLILAVLFPLRNTQPDFAEYYRTNVEPALEAAEARPLATFDTDVPSGWELQTFDTTGQVKSRVPGRPVRDGGRMFLSLSWFEDVAVYNDHLGELDEIYRQAALSGNTGPVTVWRLEPVARSRALRWSWETSGRGTRR